MLDEGGGFRHDPEALEEIKTRLRNTGDDLAEAVVGKTPGQAEEQFISTPNVGASSVVVGRTLAELISVTNGFSESAKAIASQVDSAHGGYALADNNAQGVISNQIREGMKDYPDTSKIDAPLS